MDPTSIIMLIVLAVLVFFVFRNSRKRKQQQEQLSTQMVPGAHVMTSFGLFGTIVGVDDAAATAELEIAPGTIVKVHKQTLTKVVTPIAEGTPGEPRSVEEAMEIANREAAEREAAAAEPQAEPEFGERIDETPAKPVGGSAKRRADGSDS